MKILILFFLFFSLNVFANYMSEVDMFDCNKIGRKIYGKLKTCQKEHVDCVAFSPCETTSRQDTQVDDITKPKFTKSEIEVCSDQADCETKNGIKTCIDIDEQVLMAQDFSEIYCSKPNGFDQMTVSMIREDAAKKAAWDVSPNNPVVKRASRQTRRDEIVAEISNMGIVTLPQLRVIVEKMMKDKYTND